MVLDRDAVEGEQALGAFRDERRDHRKQRRPRQVEVRQQGVDPLERVARRDQQARLGRARARRVGGLERAGRRCADREDRFFRRACGFDRGQRFRGDFVAFGVDRVGLDRVCFDGLEGARADVQEDLRVADAPAGECVEEGVGDVQARGRGGDGGRVRGVFAA